MSSQCRVSAADRGVDEDQDSARTQTLKRTDDDPVEQNPTIFAALPSSRRAPLGKTRASCRQIRRVARDQVKSLIAHRCEQVAADSFDTDSVDPRVEANGEDCSPRDVDGSHISGARLCRSHSDNPATATQVERARTRCHGLSNALSKHQAVASRSEDPWGSDDPQLERLSVS